MIQHNSYFEGGVQSLSISRHGTRATVGVIGVGSYRFDTAAAERMTVISGELEVRPDGEEAFRIYPAGTSFEIAAKSAFDVRAKGETAYLCEYLG